MKCLFVHDHVFHLSSDGYYFSGGGLPRAAWDRYLNFADSLTVIGRKGLTNITSDQALCFALASDARVSFNLLPSLSGIKSRLINFKKVKSILLEEIKESDAVVVRLPSELGLLAIKLCQEIRKPLAVEVVDCSWDGLWNYGSLAGKLYAPLMYFRVKRAVKSVNYITYVTNEFLQSRYPAKKNAITSSCSNVMLPEMQKSVLDNRLLKLTLNSSMTLGLIGSLKGRLKGVYDAIKAVKVLKDTYHNISLRVLGSGDPEPFIQYAKSLGVADIVFFDGVLPGGEKVFEWLDNIDLYIHPSYKEGLPRAVIEAMSRGCPIVASNVAGTPELIDSKFLFRPGDIDALVSKIDELLNNNALSVFEASRNFDKARSYEGKRLEDIRFKFWLNFFSSVRELN